MKALIGTKVGMTQIIEEDGTLTAVTIVQAGPMTVLRHKTEASDGYTAVQLGTGVARKLSKPVAGQVKQANVLPKIIREVRVDEIDEEALKIGASFDVSVFEKGDKVHVTGVSKGKGWAGTVKRWNFNTSKKTHGGKGTIRKPGSIGSMYPQKIFKGKRMAGQMGGDQVSVRNLTVALIDVENNLIGIKGALPGPKKSQITIKGVA
jgi:large subunit ribosomal protein L3